MINAFSAECGPNAECLPWTDTTILEGTGISRGAHHYLVTGSIGNTFHATGGYLSVDLTWSESQPIRQVDYLLERSDSCWGPYEQIAIVTADGSANYTYHDANMCCGTHPYYYRLTVTGEVVTASATPSGPEGTPPGVPGNLSCQINGNGAELTWTASSGSASAYRVLRSLGRPMNDCTDSHEVVTTTPFTSFTDGTAPHGVTLYYRVFAYNPGGSSDVSVQTNCSITTDREAEADDRRLLPLLRAQVNGTGFQFYLPQLDQASVAIYDVRGHLVATVYSEPTLAGWHTVSWNRRGRSGHVPSGIYFARLYTNLGRPATEKFLLVR